MVQVNPNAPIILRIKFKKTGKLQFISHLDLVRTMHKTVVRSRLPLWYTEGFNPKPKLVFAAPLSIGTESVVEFLDVRLTERVDCESALLSLNENMTDEMQALAVYYPEHKLTDLKWFSYTILIKTDGACDALAKECETTLLSEKLEIEKRSKSGDFVSVDIRPLIRSASCVFDGECIRISATLSADSSRFLNPEHIINALRQKCGILSNPDLTREYYSIMREEAYLEDMSRFL